MMKLISQGIGVYFKGSTIGPAYWPHHDLLVVREGEILLQTSKGSLHLQAGDAVWIPPKHQFQALVESKQGLIWVIHFQERQSSLKKTAVNVEAGLGVFRGGTRSELALALMERLHRLYLNNHWPPLAERYLSALLVELKQNAEVFNDAFGQWHRALEQWARAHLQVGLTVGDLAKQADLSESHFRKLFRTRNGISAGKYLHSLRLNEAKALLQQSLLSLKQVGDRVGYADPVAFNRAFSAHFKITPSNFRKEARLAV